MNNPSWMMIDRQNKSWDIPQDLREQDPFYARDCGWVEQMLPFIEQYSEVGDCVTDPFCGFASTLVAAHLKNRRGIGYEIDLRRVIISKERLRRLGAATQTVIHGDITQIPSVHPIDLCLTNIPYFGCEWRSDEDLQCYNIEFYQAYLENIADRFKLVGSILKEGRFCIVMVQNIHLNHQTIPQAWDIAKAIGQYLQLCDERILIYPTSTHYTFQKYSTKTDRNHEYALIFQKNTSVLDVQEGISLLREMLEQTFHFIVYGSFAAYLYTNGSSKFPSDIDLMVKPHNVSINAILNWLQKKGFRLQCWQADLVLPVDIMQYWDHYYFRAYRCDYKGQQLTIDLTFRSSAVHRDNEPYNITRIDGIPVILNAI